MQPGDNFFECANGDWLKTAGIPADRSSSGAFHDVFKATEQHTAGVSQNAGASHPAPGSNDRKITDYHAARVDTAAIDVAKKSVAGPASWRRWTPTARSTAR